MEAGLRQERRQEAPERDSITSKPKSPDGARWLTHETSTGVFPETGTLSVKATVWLKRYGSPKAVWRYKMRSQAVRRVQRMPDGATADHKRRPVASP